MKFILKIILNLLHILIYVINNIFEYIYIYIFYKNYIKILFTDYFSWNDFFIQPYNLLTKKKYKIVKYITPDILYFSVTDNIKKIKESKSKFKIFYTGENVRNNLVNKEYAENCVDFTSLSMGFDLDIDVLKDNYIRFPDWLTYFFMPLNTKDEIKEILNKFGAHHNKTKFCSLISRHDRNGIRKKIYDDLSIIEKIDCPGFFLHNDDSLKNSFNDNKINYLYQYKFNICPENSSEKGYVTEKIFQSFYSGCIPIYWGYDRYPESDIINSDALLFYEHDSNNDVLINEINELHNNDKYYKSFISKNIFLNTAVDKIHFYLQRYVEYTLNIAQKIQ